MKSEAIVLPYYGIGDFLTHLPFILALLKKNKKSKFIVLTKSRTCLLYTSDAADE